MHRAGLFVKFPIAPLLLVTCPLCLPYSVGNRDGTEHRRPVGAAEGLEQMQVSTHMLTLFLSWCFSYPRVNNEADGDRAAHHVSAGYPYFTLSTHRWESEGSCPRSNTRSWAGPRCGIVRWSLHQSPGGASETSASPGELPLYAVLTARCIERDPVGLGPEEHGPEEHGHLEWVRLLPLALHLHR